MVEAEGPVHVSLVVRRIADAFGLGRVGRRIQEATQYALQHAQREAPAELLERDGFWLTRQQDADVPVRNRSGVAGVGKATVLPPMEIVAAADWIERECGRVDDEELVREIARLLGFKRAGAELRRVITGTLDARVGKA